MKKSNVNYEDSQHFLYPPTGGGMMQKKQISENQIGWECNQVISTPHGYVLGFSANYPKWKFTRLSIVLGGIDYERRFKKAYTLRGMVTKAKQFAAEMAGELA